MLNRNGPHQSKSNKGTRVEAQDVIASSKLMSALDAKQQDAHFLRSLNTRLIKMQGAQLVVTATMIVVAIISATLVLARPVKNNYFLIDSNGRVVSGVAAISDPLVTSQKVRTFADDCVRAVLDIDFVHYKKQLGNAERCFTRSGFVQIVGLMKKRGLLAELSTGYSVARITPRQANFLSSTFAKTGTKQWVVKGTYVWSLRQGKSSTQYPLTIEVTVKPVAMDQSIYGMAITAMTVQRA